MAVLFFLTLFRLKNTLTSWSERLRHYLELSIHLENMLYETRYNGNETGSGDSLLSDYFSSPHGGDGLRVALDKVMLFFFYYSHRSYLTKTTLATLDLPFNTNYRMLN